MLFSVILSEYFASYLSQKVELKVFYWAEFHIWLNGPDSVYFDC